MVPFYLDFEEPIKKIDNQILKIKSDSKKNDLIKELEKKLSITIKSIHSSEGWNAKKIAERGLPVFKSALTPNERSGDIFSWDPI